MRIDEVCVSPYEIEERSDIDGVLGRASGSIAREFMRLREDRRVALWRRNEARIPLTMLVEIVEWAKRAPIGASVDLEWQGSEATTFRATKGIHKGASLARGLYVDVEIRRKG